jgi:hypothetical protein
MEQISQSSHIIIIVLHAHGPRGCPVFPFTSQTYRYWLFRIRVSGELGTLGLGRRLFDAIAIIIIICLRNSSAAIMVRIALRWRRMMMLCRFFRHRMGGFAVGTTHDLIFVWGWAFSFFDLLSGDETFFKDSTTTAAENETTTIAEHQISMRFVLDETGGLGLFLYYNIGDTSLVSPLPHCSREEGGWTVVFVPFPSWKVGLPDRIPASRHPIDRNEAKIETFCDDCKYGKTTRSASFKCARLQTTTENGPSICCSGSTDGSFLILQSFI